MNNLKPFLLVDDSAKDRELIIEALQENHISNRIDVACDGEEAMDYLFRRGGFADREQGNPAVILLDIKMPKVDGLEVLRQIKEDKNLKVIPVVILTSSREQSDLLKSYELGVNAYVVKPLDFDHFFNAVKELGIFWAVLNETL
jgi:CheY-like chemotaxis protein